MTTLFLHLDSLGAEVRTTDCHLLPLMATDCHCCQKDVTLRPDGRLAFRPSGEVPCVLHANGFKDVLELLEPRMRHQGAVVWSVSRRSSRGAHAAANDARDDAVTNSNRRRRFPPARDTPAPHGAASEGGAAARRSRWG